MAFMGYRGNVVHVKDEPMYLAKEANYRNVILLGDSRTGKTTFLKYLKNIDARVTPSIFYGTKLPESTTLIVNYKGELFAIRFLDTPGLNELGDDGKQRTNQEIFDSIIESVHGDMTGIHMILIVMNSIVQSGLDTIRDIMTMLGGAFYKNTFLLKTHSENIDEALEKKLFADMSKIMVLRNACQGGILFSGALNENVDQSVVTRFRRVQSLRNESFLQALIRTEMVPFKQAKIEINPAKFMTYSSSIKDLRNIVDLGSMLISRRLGAIQFQNKIREYDISSSNIGSDEKMLFQEFEKEVSTISLSDDEKMDENVKTMKEKLVNYVNESKDVSMMAEKITTESKKLGQLEEKMKTLEFLLQMLPLIKPQQDPKS